MKDELKFFEDEADKISYEEFRQWLVDGLIKSELQGVVPKTEEWHRIKKMMDKVASEAADLAIKEFKKKQHPKKEETKEESEDVTIAELAQTVQNLVTQKVTLGVSNRGGGDKKPKFLENPKEFEKHLKQAYSKWEHMQEISHLDWADMVSPPKRGLDYL